MPPGRSPYVSAVTTLSLPTGTVAKEARDTQLKKNAVVRSTPIPVVDEVAGRAMDLFHKT
jgi:hypothetical protein